MADAAGVPVPRKLRNRAVRDSPPPEDLLSRWLVPGSDDSAAAVGSGPSSSDAALHSGALHSQALHRSLPGHSEPCSQTAGVGEDSMVARVRWEAVPRSESRPPWTDVGRHQENPDLDLNLYVSGWQEDKDLDLDELGDWVPEWACRLSRRQLLDLEAAEAWRGLRALGDTAGDRCGECVIYKIETCGNFMMCMKSRFDVCCRNV